MKKLFLSNLNRWRGVAWPLCTFYENGHPIPTRWRHSYDAAFAQTRTTGFSFKPMHAPPHPLSSIFFLLKAFSIFISVWMLPKGIILLMTKFHSCSQASKTFTKYIHTNKHHRHVQKTYIFTIIIGIQTIHSYSQAWNACTKYIHTNKHHRHVQNTFILTSIIDIHKIHPY